MGRLTAKLTSTATKIATTRNEYGDVVYGATSSVPCLYRDISSLSHTANRDQVQIDGLLWFDADAGVARGDIFLVGTDYLKIERVIKAKDLLRSNVVRFIKCEVTKQRQVS